MELRAKAVAAVGFALVMAAAAAGPVAAQDSVADFYHGKTIRLIIGYSPGGGYDSYARLVAQFMGKYIPGNPAIVPQNMPGAGSRKAAAFMEKVAKQDGTFLATADQALAVAQAMHDPRLKVDAGSFNYIGSTVQDNNVLITWHTSGIKTIDDAMKKSVPIGATGSATGSAYPKVMNAILGTKFKIVGGYPGGKDINMAMENGEVAGRGSVNWASLKPLGWQQGGKVNVLVQVGLRSEPDLKGVPLLFALAKDDNDRKMLRLLCSAAAVGRPIFTTPNVPKARVEALRKAFDKMVADPDFLKAAESEGLNIDPTSGAELQKTVQDILATPPALGQKLGSIIGF